MINDMYPLLTLDLVLQDIEDYIMNNHKEDVDYEEY